MDPGLWLQGLCHVPAVWPAWVTYTPGTQLDHRQWTWPQPELRGTPHRQAGLVVLALLPFLDATFFTQEGKTLPPQEDRQSRCRDTHVVMVV